MRINRIAFESTRALFGAQRNRQDQHPVRPGKEVVTLAERPDYEQPYVVAKATPSTQRPRRCS